VKIAQPVFIQIVVAPDVTRSSIITARDGSRLPHRGKKDHRADKL
jgi:hypothetical protein